jgi:hypothetical protein
MIDIEVSSEKLVDVFLAEDLRSGASAPRLTEPSYALKDSLTRFQSGFVLTKFTYTRYRQTEVSLYISSDRKRLFMRKVNGGGRTKAFGLRTILGICYGNDSSTFLINGLNDKLEPSK